jgi:hypothetical protein
MASHAFLSGRKCRHVIGGEGGRDGNQRGERDRYNCSHGVSWAITAAPPWLRVPDKCLINQYPPNSGHKFLFNTGQRFGKKFGVAQGGAFQNE